MLDEAARVVRDRGAAELSLRELAATIGVTHAAPRRYFASRQELLDAVAVEGFARLGAQLREAVEASPDHRRQVRAIASAYLDFALAEANLVELMFAHQHGAGGEAVSAGAEAAFAPLLQVFEDAEAGRVPAGRSPERVALLFLATLHGLADLINCGVVAPSARDVLLDETVAQLPTG